MMARRRVSMRLQRRRTGSRMGQRQGGHGRRPHEAVTCDREHPCPRAQHASTVSHTRVDCSSVITRLCGATGNAVRRPSGGQRQAADMLGSWPAAPRGGDARSNWNNVWSVNSNDPYPVVQGPWDSPWFHTLLHADELVTNQPLFPGDSELQLQQLLHIFKSEESRWQQTCLHILLGTQPSTCYV